MYQVALAGKVESLMNAAKSENDRMWGSKILACGNLLATQTATKNLDQREALSAITMALLNGINDKGSPENRAKAMKESEIMGQKIANSIPDELASHMQEKYSVELNRFNSELIVASMGCASEKSLLRQKP